MTESSTGSFRQGEPETYKRLMVACSVLAGVALGVGAALEYQLVGVGLYVVGLTAALAIPYTTEYTLFDERDDVIHRRASGATLALFGWLAALVFPSLVVLSTTSYFSWGTASATLGWTTAVVYATYGVALAYYR